MEQRRSQYDRWLRRTEDPEGAPYLSAREDSYRTRSAAQQAFYRARLLVQDEPLLLLAQGAITATAQIHKATDRHAFDAASSAAEQSLDRFLAAAARYVHR